MAKIVKSVFGITLLMTICSCMVYQLIDNKIFLTFAITFGTTTYHFGVRLFVGTLFNCIMKNKMPTYDKDTFDISKHSWNEIMQATCQAELVHEANIVLSFLPIVASVWFGEFTVFFITSILSAVFDLMFVFMQRFI